MTMFRVGQLVVCVGCSTVDTVRPPLRFRGAELSLRAVYAIRDIDTRTVPIYGVATIRLEEIVNRVVQCGTISWELGYHPANFRPVATTDISWAHKLVADLPKSKTLIDS